MTEKQRVIKLAKNYLKSGNNICNLSDLVAENCSKEFQVNTFVQDTAYEMERTGKYRVEVRTMESIFVIPLPTDEVLFGKIRWLSPIVTILVSLGALAVSIYALLRK